MKFKEVKEILNDSNYWISLIDYNSNIKFLTTDFKIKRIGASTRLCETNDDFYIGEFVIIYDCKGKHCLSEDNPILYSLYYKQLQYCNTLYIDFWVDGNTYTKPIRIKKDQSINDEIIKNKIKKEIYEFEKLHMMKEAIRNYSTDNCFYKNIERRLREDKNY